MAVKYHTANIIKALDYVAIQTLILTIFMLFHLEGDARITLIICTIANSIKR